MGNTWPFKQTVRADNITQSTRLAQSGGNVQNDSLNTNSGVDFHSREIGAPWHSKQLGVGKMLGLQGMKLTNTSHQNLGMESFRSKPQVERTPVASVHTPPSQQVLPPGPVDANVDFSGLRGEITSKFPGGSGNSKGTGSGLASHDIRDIMKNKRNYSDWARHGGVDPAGSVMPMSTPAYFENVPYQKVQIKQPFPKRVSNASAQGFFDD
tara:strand:- start:147 stop:776 length:630 start_codon:yes stop_codon:yes gene_type:complete